MGLDESKKRKACQSCTKAKAKCSPTADSLNVCYRCQRLKRQCVFDETVRKRGPKNRSRVKQLEERVESLIGLLSNGQATSSNNNTSANGVQSALVTPAASIEDVEPSQRSGSYTTPADSPDPVRQIDLCDDGSPPYTPYDPIKAGLVDEKTAEALVKEFKDSCSSTFPFVIIPESADMKVLRQEQPFLFHAILAVVSNKNSDAQLALANELKAQIASRVIMQSHKSLDLLQGILVYIAWYHSYYVPVQQQLATMIQLCVGMVQDLGLSKNASNVQRQQPAEGQGIPFSSRTLAEKRAFLGTFYLTAAFSHAWRKRPVTLGHTRYVTQCLQHLADCREYATDSLIIPMIQLSALLGRINDYFSYDDIENADIKGESLLQLSVTNFETEVARLADTIPVEVRETNSTLRLQLCLLDIWIHECAVHKSFWNPSAEVSSPISDIRLKMLCRCMSAMKCFLNTLLSIPQASLSYLTFPSWAGWCYATVIACKLVFLEDNERKEQTDLPPMFAEVTRLVMDKSLFTEPRPCSLPMGPIMSTWDPISVARESGVLSLFHQMDAKMKYTLGTSASDGTRPIDCCTDPLFRIAHFQRNLLCSFTNRLNENIAKLNATKSAETNTDTRITSIARKELWITPQAEYMRERVDKAPIPLLQNLHFNSMNFDSIAPVEQMEPQEENFSDWLWNTAMDDFIMPPM